MKKICLGVDKMGEKIELDFDKEKIKFILLAGATGSGKSIFHFNLYKELSEKYSPTEIGFVFLDMTRVDFHNWSSDYLIMPVIYNPHAAIKTLHEITEIKTNKKIFIHIEECDMVAMNLPEVEKAFEKIKKMENIYVVYSTSKLMRDYLEEWNRKFINLKAVFAVATEDDSTFMLGKNDAYFFDKPGERILDFNRKQIYCQPFTDDEATVLFNFSL